ncbi:Hypothetical protein PHPALM_10383 [Phytophthora palmivora]|uniref:Uncharacterized protein n=1 Tax=Phytophthora palmivora TaxID=4796 RepID=A0A2P4Y4U6_9STRA|nr:Hypothetical protein PHPALM_10383 [Phytophthora palmivora]
MACCYRLYCYHATSTRFEERRIGHASTESRLKSVLGEYSADTSNNRWGDTLALDWTHNYTNLGFYVCTGRS